MNEEITGQKPGHIIDNVPAEAESWKVSRTQVTPIQSPQPMSAFSNLEAFEAAQRMAKPIAESDFIPSQYRGKVGDALIALELAQRMQISPIMVLQNLNVISGKPSWSAKFVIGAINSCGKFSPLRFRLEQVGTETVTYEYWVKDKQTGKSQRKEGKQTIENITCVAYATELATGEIHHSPPVSIALAVKEGWYHRSGSKWKTMPELMLRYRAASWFGSFYASEILLGMPSTEEVTDIQDLAVVDEAGNVLQEADTSASSAETLTDKLKQAAEASAEASAAQTASEAAQETVEDKPKPKRRGRPRKQPEAAEVKAETEETPDRDAVLCGLFIDRTGDCQTIDALDALRDKYRDKIKAPKYRQVALDQYVKRAKELELQDEG